MLFMHLSVASDIIVCSYYHDLYLGPRYFVYKRWYDRVYGKCM